MFIGTNVVVLDGVTIGEGAVIGAGTVVYKDVEPYAVYAGNPMRFIRNRFSSDVIESLLEIKWWEKSINWIQRNADSFDSPEHFLKINDLHDD